MSMKLAGRESHPPPSEAPTMYRIELSPGEQTVFRTIEELATGIRNGVISPRARIYHGASDKWLPIEFHPHYKKALESLTTGKPIEEPVSTATPAAPPAPAPAVAPLPAQAAEPRALPIRAARDETVTEIELPSFAFTEPPAPEPAPAAPEPRRSPGGQRPMRLAVVGAAAIFSTHVVLSAAPPRIELPPEPAVAAIATASVEAPAVAPRLQPGHPTAPAVRAPAPPKPSAQPHDSATDIQPPPAELDLSIPSLPRADSITPGPSARDTVAMKRILRAVGGPQQ